MTLSRLLYFIELASKHGKYRLAIRLTEQALSICNGITNPQQEVYED